MYQLKYKTTSEEEIDEILKLSISNDEPSTDNEEWIANSSSRVDTDLELAEEAISLFKKPK